MDKLAKGRGGGHSVASLNNVLMQMRKNCNHPDLITGPYDGEGGQGVGGGRGGGGRGPGARLGGEGEAGRGRRGRRGGAHAASWATGAAGPGPPGFSPRAPAPHHPSPPPLPPGSAFYPPPEQLCADSGKMALLDRLLTKLLPEGHKVLIFSQVGVWVGGVGGR